MIAVGSENGVVKLLNLKTQKVAKQWGSMSTDREICSMCWGDDEKSVFTGLKNGNIEWTTTSGELVKTFSKNLGQSGLESVTGLTLLENNRFD
jgi:WD40 repeat protein